MRRTTPRRQPDHAGNVTKQAPAAPAAQPPLAAPARPREESAPTALPKVGWGWRLALFLWAASFVFLFLYEILISLFRGGPK
jgi:hypothetical protein